MPRPIRNLSNMEIDEVSLVDKGANQHAMITIAKRATEEEAMPEFYDENGKLVDENALEIGDVVYDAEGQAYRFEAEEEETAQEPELAVAKSAFGKRQTADEKSFGEELREELAKAFSDDDRDEVISKALGRLDEIEKAQKKAEEIAKAERDLRLTREYVEVAKSYNLPVAGEELGPVLYRMAETMSYEDCAVIAKCLESAGEILFQELGFQGGGENGDVMDFIQAQAVEIGKSAEGFNGQPSPQHLNAVLDSNPQAYDEYLASQRGF